MNPVANSVNGNKIGQEPESLGSRLRELRQEFAKGEAQLENLERQRHQLRDTLLRISGAIQVLQELLEQHPAPPGLFSDQAAREAAAAQSMLTSCDNLLPAAPR